MPSLRLHKNTNQLTANSLRAHLFILKAKRPVKRVSSFASLKLGASLTVEASLALPLFLFFIIQIMLAMNMIGVQSRLSAALHQTGNQMAFAGYVYEKTAGGVLPDEIASIALTQGYAKNQIISCAGENYLNRSCIKNGAAGISFQDTSIMQKNDIVEICLSYRVQSFFPLIGFDGFMMRQRYYGRAWTGYDVENKVSNFTEKDPMVYVTETGTVYHTNRDCTYLNPSVSAVRADTVDSSRNQSGGRYMPCEICGQKGSAGTVYITGQGDRYHTLITCSGLKRTIYTIPLSEVGGRRKCSKCG